MPVVNPRVPEGLRDLMKDLTKEVLREKPPNIYEFSEHYFESMLQEKQDFTVKGYEPAASYENILQTRERNQIPVALVFKIIPEGLTALIKDFIKAVLRETPENLCEFAVEYFRRMRKEGSNETAAVQYDSYNNYFQSKERFSFTPYVKCTCGRTFGEGMVRETEISVGRVANGVATTEHLKNSTNGVLSDTSQENETRAQKEPTKPKESSIEKETMKNDVEMNNNESLPPKGAPDGADDAKAYDEAYIKAIHVIQRFFKRHLRKKRPAPAVQDQEAPVVSKRSMTEEAAAIIIQRSLRKLFTDKFQRIEKMVPNLEINQHLDEHNDNVSEAASYTSASTVQMSAESAGEATARDNIEAEVVVSEEQDVSHTIVGGDDVQNEDASGLHQRPQSVSNSENTNTKLVDEPYVGPTAPLITGQDGSEFRKSITSEKEDVNTVSETAGDAIKEIARPLVAINEEKIIEGSATDKDPEICSPEQEAPKKLNTEKETRNSSSEPLIEEEHDDKLEILQSTDQDNSNSENMESLDETNQLKNQVEKDATNFEDGTTQSILNDTLKADDISLVNLLEAKPQENPQMEKPEDQKMIRSDQTPEVIVPKGSVSGEEEFEKLNKNETYNSNSNSDIDIMSKDIHKYHLKTGLTEVKEVPKSEVNSQSVMSVKVEELSSSNLSEMDTKHSETNLKSTDTPSDFNELMESNKVDVAKGAEIAITETTDSKESLETKRKKRSTVDTVEIEDKTNHVSETVNEDADVNVKSEHIEHMDESNNENGNDIDTITKDDRNYSNIEVVKYSKDQVENIEKCDSNVDLTKGPENGRTSVETTETIDKLNLPLEDLRPKEDLVQNNVIEAGKEHIRVGAPDIQDAANSSASIDPKLLLNLSDSEINNSKTLNIPTEVAIEEPKNFENGESVIETDSKEDASKDIKIEEPIEIKTTTPKVSHSIEIMDENKTDDHIIPDIPKESETEGIAESPSEKSIVENSESKAIEEETEKSVDKNDENNTKNPTQNESSRATETTESKEPQTNEEVESDILMNVIKTPSKDEILGESDKLNVVLETNTDKDDVKQDVDTANDDTIAAAIIISSKNEEIKNQTLFVPDSTKETEKSNDAETNTIKNIHEDKNTQENTDFIDETDVDCVQSDKDDQTIRTPSQKLEDTDQLSNGATEMNSKEAVQIDQNDNVNGSTEKPREEKEELVKISENASQDENPENQTLTVPDSAKVTDESTETEIDVIKHDLKDKNIQENIDITVETEADFVRPDKDDQTESQYQESSIQSSHETTEINSKEAVHIDQNDNVSGPTEKLKAENEELVKESESTITSKDEGLTDSDTSKVTDDSKSTEKDVVKNATETKNIEDNIDITEETEAENVLADKDGQTETTPSQHQESSIQSSDGTTEINSNEEVYRNDDVNGLTTNREAENEVSAKESERTITSKELEDTNLTDPDTSNVTEESNVTDVDNITKMDNVTKSSDLGKTISEVDIVKIDNSPNTVQPIEDKSINVSDISGDHGTAEELKTEGEKSYIPPIDKENIALEGEENKARSKREISISEGHDPTRCENEKPIDNSLPQELSTKAQIEENCKEESESCIEKGKDNQVDNGLVKAEVVDDVQLESGAEHKVFTGEHEKEVNQITEPDIIDTKVNDNDQVHKIECANNDQKQSMENNAIPTVNKIEENCKEDSESCIEKGKDNQVDNCLVKPEEIDDVQLESGAEHKVITGEHEKEVNQITEPDIIDTKVNDNDQVHKIESANNDQKQSMENNATPTVKGEHILTETDAQIARMEKLENNVNTRSLSVTDKDAKENHDQKTAIVDIDSSPEVDITEINNRKEISNENENKEESPVNELHTQDTEIKSDTPTHDGDYKTSLEDNKGDGSNQTETKVEGTESADYDTSTATPNSLAIGTQNSFKSRNEIDNSENSNNVEHIDSNKKGDPHKWRKHSEYTGPLFAEIHLKSFNRPIKPPAPFIPEWMPHDDDPIEHSSNKVENETKSVDESCPGDVASVNDLSSRKMDNTTDELKSERNILTEDDEAIIKLYGENERTPTYLYGIHTPRNTPTLPRKNDLKSNTAFTVPFNDLADTKSKNKSDEHFENMNVRIAQEGNGEHDASQNNNKHVKLEKSVSIQKNPELINKPLPLNLQNSDDHFEAEIDLETPTKLFAELTQFDDLDATLTAQEAEYFQVHGTLPTSADVQRSDDLDATTETRADAVPTHNDDYKMLSTPDTTLNTIVEVNESDELSKTELTLLNEKRILSNEDVASQSAKQYIIDALNEPYDPLEFGSGSDNESELTSSWTCSKETDENFFSDEFVNESTNDNKDHYRVGRAIPNDDDENMQGGIYEVDLNDQKDAFTNEGNSKESPETDLDKNKELIEINESEEILKDGVLFNEQVVIDESGNISLFNECTSDQQIGKEENAEESPKTDLDKSKELIEIKEAEEIIKGAVTFDDQVRTEESENEDTSDNANENSKFSNNETLYAAVTNYSGENKLDDSLTALVVSESEARIDSHVDLLNTGSKSHLEDAEELDSLNAALHEVNEQLENTELMLDRSVTKNSTTEEDLDFIENSILALKDSTIKLSEINDLILQAPDPPTQDPSEIEETEANSSLNLNEDHSEQNILKELPNDIKFDDVNKESNDLGTDCNEGLIYTEIPQLIEKEENKANEDIKIIESANLFPQAQANDEIEIDAEKITETHGIREVNESLEKIRQAGDQSDQNISKKSSNGTNPADVDKERKDIETAGSEEITTLLSSANEESNIIVSANVSSEAQVNDEIEIDAGKITETRGIAEVNKSPEKVELKKEKAARTIQRGYRHYANRKLKKISKRNTFKHVDRVTPEDTRKLSEDAEILRIKRNNAAKVIQKAFRNYSYNMATSNLHSNEDEFNVEVVEKDKISPNESTIPFTENVASGSNEIKCNENTKSVHPDRENLNGLSEILKESDINKSEEDEEPYRISIDDHVIDMKNTAIILQEEVPEKNLEIEAVSINKYEDSDFNKQLVNITNNVQQPVDNEVFNSEDIDNSKSLAKTGEDQTVKDLKNPDANLEINTDSHNVDHALQSKLESNARNSSESIEIRTNSLATVAVDDDRESDDKNQEGYEVKSETTYEDSIGEQQIDIKEGSESIEKNCKPDFEPSAIAGLTQTAFDKKKQEGYKVEAEITYEESIKIRDHEKSASEGKHQKDITEGNESIESNSKTDFEPSTTSVTEQIVTAKTINKIEDSDNTITKDDETNSGTSRDGLNIDSALQVNTDNDFDPFNNDGVVSYNESENAKDFGTNISNTTDLEKVGTTLELSETIVLTTNDILSARMESKYPKNIEESTDTEVDMHKKGDQSNESENSLITAIRHYKSMINNNKSEEVINTPSQSSNDDLPLESKIGSDAFTSEETKDIADDSFIKVNDEDKQEGIEIKSESTYEDEEFEPTSIIANENTTMSESNINKEEAQSLTEVKAIDYQMDSEPSICIEQANVITNAPIPNLIETSTPKNMNTDIDTDFKVVQNNTCNDAEPSNEDEIISSNDTEIKIHSSMIPADVEKDESILASSKSLVSLESETSNGAPLEFEHPKTIDQPNDGDVDSLKKDDQSNESQLISENSLITAIRHYKTTLDQTKSQEATETTTQANGDQSLESEIKSDHFISEVNKYITDKKNEDDKQNYSKSKEVTTTSSKSVYEENKLDSMVINLKDDTAHNIKKDEQVQSHTEDNAMDYRLESNHSMNIEQLNNANESLVTKINNELTPTMVEEPTQKILEFESKKDDNKSKASESNSSALKMDTGSNEKRIGSRFENKDANANFMLNEIKEHQENFENAPDSKVDSENGSGSVEVSTETTAVSQDETNESSIEEPLVTIIDNTGNNLDAISQDSLEINSDSFNDTDSIDSKTEIESSEIRKERSTEYIEPSAPPENEVLDAQSEDRPKLEWYVGEEPIPRSEANNALDSEIVPKVIDELVAYNELDASPPVDVVNNHSKLSKEPTSSVEPATSPSINSVPDVKVDSTSSLFLLDPQSISHISNLNHSDETVSAKEGGGDERELGQEPINLNQTKEQSPSDYDLITEGKSHEVNEVTINVEANEEESTGKLVDSNDVSGKNPVDAEGNVQESNINECIKKLNLEKEINNELVAESSPEALAALEVMKFTSDFLNTERNNTISKDSTTKKEIIASKETEAELKPQDQTEQDNEELESGAKDTTKNIKALSEFLNLERRYWESDIPYTKMEQRCIKKSVSLTHLDNDEPSVVEATSEEQLELQVDAESEQDACDSLGAMTEKLLEADAVIEKMQQRRASETRSNLLDVKEPSFEEPIVIKSMQELQDNRSNEGDEDEVVVLNRLQREDTRQSSAESDSVVFGPDQDDDTDFNDLPIVKASLHRLNTIAGDDPKSLFKSVTIDDTVKYIDPPESETTATSGSSFCMDDDMSENIRQKMMAYSLSEADSDYFEAEAGETISNGEKPRLRRDDFNISTALVDTAGTSSDTESSIASAATKIQAGARGFLTRRRLRRASAGTKTSQQDNDKASFGNEAIGESLEKLIEEEAAKKIQKAYRNYYRQKGVHSLPSSGDHEDTNNPRVAKAKTGPEEDPLALSSFETTLAARRMTLQRGDAMRNDSTPDEENGNGRQLEKIADVIQPASLTDESTRTAAAVAAAVHVVVDVGGSAKTSKIDNELKWIALRQNSMPVQIDSEIFRVIPKHMRKRIQSAGGDKKRRLRVPKD